MLSVLLDKVNHVAILEMEGPMSEPDYCSAASKVGLLVAEDGKLNGIVIRAKAFPGWESIAAVVSHLKYSKNHLDVPRVAIVTASMTALLMEIFSTHLVSAEIRIFPYRDVEKANRWITGKTKISPAVV